MPPKKRRRFWRVFWVLLVLFALLILALPHAIALDFVRVEAQANLSQALGVPCRIDRIGFSWFSGVGVQGVEISNPPGFSREQPCLRLARIGGDISLSKALSGRIDFGGSVDGLEIRIEEDAAGNTNFATLFGSSVEVHSGSTSEPRPGGRPRQPTTTPKGDKPQVQGLERLQFDLRLREALLEIRRNGALVEAVSNISCNAQKTFDSKKVTLDLTADLQPTATSPQLGQLAVKVDADVTTQDLDFMFSAAGLDLSRYHPLVAAFLPGQLTELAGLVDGTLTARVSGDGAVSVDGNLTVREPRLAGPLVRGMHIASDRWVIAPTLSVASATTEGLQHVVTDRFDADFGCVRLRGVGQEERQTLLGDARLLAFRCEADLDALAAFGGPMPSWLAGTKGRTECVIGIPPSLQQLGIEELQRQIVVVGTASSERLAVQGYEFTGLGLSSSLRGGRLEVTTTQDSKLNRGPLTATLTAEFGDAGRRPATLRLAWTDGQLGAPATGLLRHLVPLLTGLDAEAADLRGIGELQFEATGPSAFAPGQNWLQLLDDWSADGHLALRETSFAPAPALRGLLQPLGAALGDAATLGDGNRLAIDAFRCEFRMDKGHVTTKLGEWLAHGQKIGLKSSVGLDGKLACDIDFSGLLAAHKDGARVLAALGGSLPAANLGGTLDAPTLGLPDLAAAVRQAATKELEKKGGDLLKRGLDELLKRKN
ncbi:MAG: hypothetical protein H6838_01835 [Planctomycetes bacterium]|nr:hypothetical protein [Planctomycetota bacterium]